MPTRRRIRGADDAQHTEHAEHTRRSPSSTPRRTAAQPEQAPQTFEAAGTFDAAAARASARYFDADTAAFLDDLPLIQAYARTTHGPLLELGCGTGRLLVPLARAGYAVTGIDLSPDMLALAQSKAEAAEVAERVTLLQGDFGRVTIPETYYRLAFIVMNTFLHLLTMEEQLRALRHWHAHLAPGGMLLIDVFAPDVRELANLQGQVEFDKTWLDPASGAIVMKQFIRTVDQAEQLMHTLIVYDEVAADGRLERTVVPFDLRYIWRFEAELLLEQAGFMVEDVFGDWDLGPFDASSERLILVARKG